MDSIVPPDTDSKLDARSRRSEAFYAGMQAVRDMASDWYCPRSEPGRPRRECPECIAEVALDAYEADLWGDA
jgi:hypothetical protein